MGSNGPAFTLDEIKTEAGEELAEFGSRRSSERPALLRVTILSVTKWQGRERAALSAEQLRDKVQPDQV